MYQKYAILALTLLTASTCSSGIQTTPSGDQSVAPEPGEQSTRLSAEWTKTAPSGDTMCADDSEFFLMTHQEDPEKLLFFLEGGGGCSASHTCDPKGDPTYKMSLADQPLPDAGIFDLQNSKTHLLSTPSSTSPIARAMFTSDQTIRFMIARTVMSANSRCITAAK